MARNDAFKSLVSNAAQAVSNMAQATLRNGAPGTSGFASIELSIELADRA